jgi:2-dehydropantoate 2-reductase
MKKILILGAGAIGGCVAANFSQANIDHMIIDPWPELIDQLRSHGLHISMIDEQYQTAPLQAIHLHALSSMPIRPFDIVFLASKAGDAKWLSEFILPYLHPKSIVVVLMNGMMNQDVAGIIGPERTVGCVLELSAESFQAGFIKRKTPPSRTWMCLGELDGQITPRLKEVQALLQHVAKVDLTSNIEGAKWTKLVTNAMVLAPFAMLKAQSYEALQLPQMHHLILQIGLEAIYVGQALGYQLEGIFGLSNEEMGKEPQAIAEKLVATLLGHIGKQSQNAVTQDVIKQRRTETHYLNGLIVRQGITQGIPTPANRAIVEVMHQIEQQKISAGMHNIDLATQLVQSFQKNTTT